MFKNYLCPFISQVKVDYNNILAFRLSQTMFKLQHEILSFCTYIPLVDSPYYSKNSDNSNLIYQLDECLANLYNKYECPFLICGDCNTRASNIQQIDLIQQTKAVFGRDTLATREDQPPAI
ncbi:hypothetical protein ElyMa_000259300 [Elysia marginata]|uniref:Endonuclease/exonuclease/phosphatase domain-containing protein n=1 Tax=Elysia marginata TaxID=1093978 RepID=A0AAV4F5T5_9GAST|nr:hypothetical protein ElyMa_000259300 [Elysia marginata]